MDMTIQSLSVALLMASPAPDASADKISLWSEERWALVTGLHRQLGGPFIIANLEEGDATCAASKACIAVEAIREETQSGVTGEVTSLDDLLSQTAIGDRQPVAIVALRSAMDGKSYYRRGLTLSLYERATGAWTMKDVRFGWGPSGFGGVGTVGLREMRDSAVQSDAN
jgi:hypothetical protein